MKLRKMSIIALCGIFLISMQSVAFASDGSEERSSSSSIGQASTAVEFICENRTRDLTWGNDGGRENNSAQTLQRVWGWSTCKNSIGTDVEHYTRSRYENRITGVIYGDSGRVFGTGKVYARSPWENKTAASVMAARVYYGT